MEPRIQYAKAGDGVNIAFWAIGEGQPLVCMTNLIWSHAQLEWQFSESRRWYEALATRRKLVRFDPRGAGLSQRNVEEWSLPSLVLDLEAVVDHLGLQTFALFASINAGPVAISYSAQHPERVSELILWCTQAGTSARHPTARWSTLATLQPLMDSDWETYTQNRARMELDWKDEALADRFATFLQQCTKPQMALRAYREIDKFDVESLLPRVSAPTLVVHRRQYAFADEEASTRLAAGIPDARLAVFEGSAGTPYLGATDAELNAIMGFLGEDNAAPFLVGHPAVHSPSGTAVILFADIVDSTALTERLGDAAFRSKARELGGSLRKLILHGGGTPVEGPTLGDGLLAVFTSAREAIEAALSCGKAGDDAGLPLHLGLHAGDVIRESDPDGRANVYGGAVNIAARVSGLSAPGEVLVSDTVRSLARTSADVTFEDRGEQMMKGVAGPVRVFAVRQA
jgi:class 3 adenylate cyclase/pimeloyl-ACP methyl ester carboxylesterase